MKPTYEPSPLAIAAGLATIFGAAITPTATAPALVLAATLAFAGVRRVALIVAVLLVLAGTAGLRVDQADRASPAARTAER